MSDNVEILTARLCIAPLQFPVKELVRTHLGWLNDPEVMKYSENRHHRHTYKLCEKYINSFDHQQNHLWAILDKQVKRHPAEPWTDHYLGHLAAYRDPNNKIAEVGILLGERIAWNRGLGTEAWKGVCDWLLSNGTRKIEAGCMAVNKPMTRIFEKTGMLIEGRRKDHFLFDGQPSDMIMAARYK